MVCRPARSGFLDLLKPPKPTTTPDNGFFISVYGKLTMVSPKDRFTEGNRIETAICIYHTYASTLTVAATDTGRYTTDTCTYKAPDAATEADTDKVQIQTQFDFIN